MATNRKHKEDKFYTKPSVVRKLVRNIDLSQYDLLIEPSAGSGSFVDLIQDYNYLALDINPEDSRIKKQDWFTFKLDRKKYDKVLVIGNPPFGNQGNLAMGFVIKATEIGADTIAFILPKSFKKSSVQNKIPLNYHLVKEIDLDDDSFTLEGRDYPVPCVFQIWDRRHIERNRVDLPVKTKFFDFVKKDDEPDFAVRRVGYYAGKVSDEVEDKSIQTHYFIKHNKNMRTEKIKKILRKLEWEHNNTAGPRSIGKGELINKFEEVVKAT